MIVPFPDLSLSYGFINFVFNFVFNFFSRKLDFCMFISFPYTLCYFVIPFM